MNWSKEEIEYAESMRIRSMRCCAMALNCRADDKEFFIRIGYAKENAEAGEWGLAVDTICSNIHEYDIRIPSELFEELKDLCDIMQLDPYLLTNIEPLVDQKTQHDAREPISFS